MDAARWLRLSPLLDALLELPPSQRDEHLATLRREDAALADELQQLLDMEADDPTFMSEPVVELPMGAHPGARVGPYKLERLIGEGGMGQVWLAIRADGLYERKVALKLLRPGLADPRLRQRFDREREILARFAHPFIARLLDAGIDRDGQPYLALEYVDGEPLTTYCQSRQLDIAARLDLFRQVCEAVSHAHANLIVHRDLKPSNILVTPAGHVRLLDFGIAKLLDVEPEAVDKTRTGVRTFTLHYAAPEQIRGEPVTTMTDVYSLGVVLYELLTGSKPYRLKRQTDAEWEEAILDGEPLKPSQAAARAEPGLTRPYTPTRLARELGGDLDNITLRALAKQPDKRYVSAEALSQDLLAYLRGRPVAARGEGLAYRAGKYIRRHRWQLAAAAMVVTSLVASSAFTWHKARKENDALARSQAVLTFVGNLFTGDENDGGYGNKLSAAEMLDRAASRIDAAFPGDPLGKAELFATVAGAYRRMGMDATGAGYARRAVELSHPFRRQQPELYLKAVLILADSLRSMGRHEDVIALVGTELEFALDHDLAAAAHLRAIRGATRRYRSALEASATDLRAALRLAEKADAAPRLRADISDQLSMTLSELGDNDQALALRQKEYALRKADPDTTPQELLKFRYQEATLLWRMARNREAIAELEAILPEMDVLLGPSHKDSQQVRRRLANFYAGEGEYARAMALVEPVLQAGKPVTSISQSNLHQTYALQLINLGQADRALAIAKASMDYQLALSRNPDRWRAVAQWIYGEALLRAGRCGKAVPVLRAALDDALTVRDKSFTLQADASDSLGRCALLQGDAAGAAKLLDAAIEQGLDEHGHDTALSLRSRAHRLWAASVAGDRDAPERLRSLRPRLAEALGNPLHPVLAQFDQLLAALEDGKPPAGFSGLNPLS